MHNFITIAVKPHVAQFLRKFEDFKKIHNKLHIANSKKLLTSNSALMLRDISDDLEKIKINLPSDLSQMFVHQDHVRSISNMMSEIFQEHLRHFVAREVNPRMTKEDAVKKFRQVYHITESLYSTGNVRRQLLRGNILGFHANIPTVERHISRKLLPSECMQIYRLVKKGYSYRTIANHYKISFKSVGNIFNKISGNVSYNYTDFTHQTAA